MGKNVGIAIIALILAGSIVASWNSRNKLLAENARLKNNIEYYGSLGDENIVLQATVAELKKSKDSVVQKMDSVRKALGLKAKTVRSLVYVETQVVDTLHDTIPMAFNFEKVVNANDQTRITVVRKDTALTVIPDIRNEQTIVVDAQKDYVYDTFFKRLRHFNFRKCVIERYYVVNSNELIRIEDTRVVDLVP